MSDRLAPGAVAAERGVGLGVPGGLSVVGFDDVANDRLEGSFLTTIRYQVAAATKRLLTEMRASTHMREADV